jgi:hypothetical protein
MQMCGKKYFSSAERKTTTKGREGDASDERLMKP